MARRVGDVNIPRQVSASYADTAPSEALQGRESRSEASEPRCHGVYGTCRGESDFVAVMNATKFNSHLQPVAQRPAQTVRARSKMSGILHIPDTAARQTQLRRQKAVNAHASRLRNDTDNFQPVGGACAPGHDFLAHGGLVDVHHLELAPQRLERQPTGQLRVEAV